MITLSMIVKNETSTLANCLNSVKPFVDAIKIVDTGSTDGTEALAQSLGAEVYPFEWCNDFSAARNYALSLVETPWTLWLDADDVVQNPEILPNLAQMAHKNRFSAVWSTYKQDRVSFQRRLQLFKTKAYKWEGVVHESPCIKPGHPPDTLLSELVVIHRKPADRCPLAARAYLDILLEKDPDNWIGLGESYKYLAIHPDDPEQVQTHLEKAEINYFSAWQWEQSNEDTKYMCLLNLAQLNIQLADYDAQRITLAKRYSQAAIATRPDRAEGYVFFGHCALKEEAPALAKEAFERALTLSPPRDCIGIVYHQHYDTVPKQLLQVADKMLEEQTIARVEEEILKPQRVIWTPGQV